VPATVWALFCMIWAWRVAMAPSAPERSASVLLSAAGLSDAAVDTGSSVAEAAIKMVSWKAGPLTALYPCAADWGHAPLGPMEKAVAAHAHVRCCAKHPTYSRRNLEWDRSPVPVKFEALPAFCLYGLFRDNPTLRMHLRTLDNDIRIS